MIASMNTPALKSTEPSAPIAPAPAQTLAVPAEPSPSPLATGAQGATAAEAIACALAAPERTAEEAAALGDLSESDVALMTGEDEGYVVKFKAIELWEDFKGWAEGR